MNRIMILSSPLKQNEQKKTMLSQQSWHTLTPSFNTVFINQTVCLSGSLPFTKAHIIVASIKFNLYFPVSAIKSTYLGEWVLSRNCFIYWEDKWGQFSASESKQEFVTEDSYFELKSPILPESLYLNHCTYTYFNSIGKGSNRTWKYSQRL